MARFTQQQLDDLAQHYHDLSFEVGQTRLNLLKSGADLTDLRIVKLQTRQFNLLHTSTRFAAEAASLELSNADAAANAIAVSTKAADAALDHLKNIDKALNIASAAFELGTAIFTGNLDQIAAAGKTLFEASTAPAEPDADASPRRLSL
jgi:hypothetical protein